MRMMLSDHPEDFIGVWTTFQSQTQLHKKQFLKFYGPMIKGGYEPVERILDEVDGMDYYGLQERYQKHGRRSDVCVPKCDIFLCFLERERDEI